jgi:hypothetical protein
MLANIKWTYKVSEDMFGNWYNIFADGMIIDLTKIVLFLYI